MEEFIKAKGHISIRLYDENGKEKDHREIENLVVTVGKTFLATWLAAASQSTSFMPYVLLGTGTTPASTSDTGLTTPLATYVLGTLTSSSNAWTNTATFNAGVNTGTITEAGLFSSNSSGTMFAHQVFSAVTKASGDTLQLVWTVTFS